MARRSTYDPLSIFLGVSVCILLAMYFFDDANTMTSDDAVIFDASYTYQVTENVAVDVIVNNVFDEKHVAYGGFGADFYNPGRSVNATLRYMW